MVPIEVGAHIHVKATVPADGVIVNGRYDMPVTVTLHDARGATSWFRVGTEDQQLHQGNLVLGPCADCSVSFTVQLDFSGVPTGRHELRMSANNPDEDPDLAGSQRMFPSTGFQVCVRSCSPTYRSGTHIEARGWYTDHEYQNAKLTSPVSSLRAGASFGVRLGPGSGGEPTTLSGVFVDPSFHDADPGRVLMTSNGPFTGNVTLPALASGPHKLVLLSSDGQNAGVLVVPFVVP